MCDKNQAATIVSFTERIDFAEMEHAAQLGSLLPTDSARALEKILLVNPTDFLSRARLLGYYWKLYEGTADAVVPDESRNRVAHILWFIENAPDCVFAGDYYLSCDSKKDMESYREVKAAWTKQIKRHPSLTQSLINFALFVFDAEPELAAELLLEAARIEPLNEWVLAVLPLLGREPQKTLPLPADVDESPPAVEQFEERMRLTERLLLHHLNHVQGSNASVKTQEKILQHDQLDVWARFNILKWCQRNMERANRLGFDPSVAQRWYRHAFWIVSNVPYLDLVIVNAPDFGLTTKVPLCYFTAIKEAFIQALQAYPNDERIIINATNFFAVNISRDETKKLIFPLRAWKNIERKTRQKLLKELNSRHTRKTIFEKNIDLNSCSRFIDCEIGPPSVPAELSTWADELNLSQAKNDGYAYSVECGSNLERALGFYGTDLISTARLAGYYARNYKTLNPEQLSRFRSISEWMIANIPESDSVTSVISGGSDGTTLSSLRSLWLQQIQNSPNNSRVATNAASWLSRRDADTALKIAERISEYEPESISAVALVHWLTSPDDHRLVRNGFRDFEFEAVCEQRISNSHADANTALAACCDEIGINLYCALDCLRVSSLTLWTNEQALRMNPNDVILRCEMLGWFDRNELWRTRLTTYNPQIARMRTMNILYLLENAPDADLHFFLRYHDPFGILSHQKILDRAVAAQRRRYGKKVGTYRPEFPRKKKELSNPESN